MATLYFNGAVDNDWARIGSYATGSISFSDQPSDGDTLTIGDVIFEFDNDNTVAEGNIAIPIGEDLLTTKQNTRSTIIDNLLINSDDNINYYANNIGESSNYSITTTSSVITAVSMSGGNDTNWWTDVACTIPSTTLPTSSDDVFLNAVINSNSGSEPTVANLTTSYGIVINALTVTGVATFNSILYYMPTLTGNCVFNGDSYVGFMSVINGDCTFNGTATTDASITGDCVFNDSSSNRGSIIGVVTFNNNSYNNSDYYYNRSVYSDATFNDTSHNDGTVYGNGTFNDNSYNIGTVDENATFNGNSTNSTATSESPCISIVNGRADFKEGSVNYGSAPDAHYYDSSFNASCGVCTGEGWISVLENRQSYPIPRGINGSNILGVI